MTIGPALAAVATRHRLDAIAHAESPAISTTQRDRIILRRPHIINDGSARPYAAETTGRSKISSTCSDTSFTRVDSNLIQRSEIRDEAERDAAASTPPNIRTRESTTRGASGGVTSSHSQEQGRTMETTTSRRNARRNKSNRPVVIGIAVVVVLVIALVIGFVGFSGNDKRTPAAGTTGAANSAAALLTKALAEMKSGDLSSAKNDLVQISKVDPQNKYAYYDLGYIAQTQKQNSDAILRADANDINGAIVLYRQAVASDPQDAKAHFNLGLLLRQSGQTGPGNVEVQAAVKISPDLKTAAAAQGVPAK
jgi:tetratricopeptide (TPR) repeat protein